MWHADRDSGTSSPQVQLISAQFQPAGSPSNRYSLAGSYYEPSCAVPPPAAAPEAQLPVCGWVCDAVHGISGCGLAVTALSILVSIALNREDVRDETSDFVIAVVLAAVTLVALYWPVLVSDSYLMTGHWAVIYLGVPAALAFGAGAMPIALMVALDSDGDCFAGFAIVCCCCSAVGVVGSLVYLRVWGTGDDAQEVTAAVEPQFEFECTWPCETMHAFQLVQLLLVQLSGVTVTWYMDEPEEQSCSMEKASETNKNIFS